MEFEKAIREVIEGLQEAGATPVIGGSYASSAWGEPRATHDLDLVIRQTGITPGDLVWTLPTSIILNEREATDAFNSREEFRCFQLFHKSGLKVDVFVVDDTEYSQSEMARSLLMSLGEGFQARFSSPENIVLAKLRWYKLGNRASDRQWRDIIKVLEVQSNTFDEQYLLRWAKYFGVLDLAEEAIQEARHPFGEVESEPER